MQSPFDGEISAHFKTKAPDTARQTIDGETKGVAPAVDYCHFGGREDLIAETALKGYCIFSDLMGHFPRWSALCHHSVCGNGTRPFKLFTGTSRSLYLYVRK